MVSYANLFDDLTLIIELVHKCYPYSSEFPPCVHRCQFSSLGF